MKKSTREEAYRTLVEPIPKADTARELGVSLAFINHSIERGEIWIGRWLHTFYSSIEQPFAMIDSQGHSVSMNWSPSAGLNSMVDSAGRSTSWGYDAQNRVVSKTYPDGTGVSIGYENTTSRVKTVTDALGQIATRTYNKDNTVAQVAYTNATVATPSTSFTYDTVYQRPLTMVDGTGTTTYHYNDVSASTLGSGRISSIQAPLATLSFGYDQLGREITEGVNDSATGQGLSDNAASIGYDSLGRIASVTNPLSGSGAFTYGYLGNTGRVSSFTNPNGQSTIYSYQDSSTTGEPRLSEIKNLNAASTVFSKFDYAYNTDGQITTWTQQADTNDPQAYALQYDNVGKLTGATVSDTTTSALLHTYAYDYDSADNRTNAQLDSAITPATYNTLNQYTTTGGNAREVFAGSLSEAGTVTVGGTSATMDSTFTKFTGSAWMSGSGATNNIPIVATSPQGYASTNMYQVVLPGGTTTDKAQYDAAGNLTSEGSYDGTGTLIAGTQTAYASDAKGELVKITHPDTSYTAFTYNGNGERVAVKQYDSTPSHNLTSTKQFVGGGLLVEERNSSNQVTKRFFSQGEQDVSGSTATSYYYTRDHLGSVREVLDNSGTIQARYSYDLWGARSVVSGSFDCEFGFTGYYLDDASGLWFSPTRAYNSTLGRWISRDPSGEGSGLNLYAYCDNDPVNKVDLNGAEAEALIAAPLVRIALLYFAYYEISHLPHVPISLGTPSVQTASAAVVQAESPTQSQAIAIPYNLPPSNCNEDGPGGGDSGEQTIGDIIGDEHPDSMVHLTVASEKELASGLYPESIFVRYGDVSHMTMAEYQEGVVQPLAAGYGKDVQGFALMKPGSGQFTLHWEMGPAGVKEYSSVGKLMPDAYLPLNPK